MYIIAHSFACHEVSLESGQLHSLPFNFWSPCDSPRARDAPSPGFVPRNPKRRHLWARLAPRTPETVNADRPCMRLRARPTPPLLLFGSQPVVRICLLAVLAPFEVRRRGRPRMFLRARLTPP